MKKTLAIAIAAGLAVPMAVMADTTLYGSAHVSLDSIDLDGANGTNTGLSSNKSYLGVKGSEKISDGLSAVYKAEFGVAYGNPGSTFTNRDQWVGLKGSAGTIIAGRASTPFKGVGAKADLFWYSQLGSQRSINGSDVRADNMIAYITPKLGGFSAKYAHIFEEGNNNATADSASAYYKAGGLLVGLGLENLGGNDDTDTRLMASYDTGKFKVVGFLENVNPAGNAADRDVAGIGASVKTAKGTVKGQYYTTSFDTGTNNDGSLFAIGYDHNLSKRTVVYAIAAATDQDAGLAGLTLGAGGGHGENVAAGAGEDQSGISLGIRHKF